MERHDPLEATGARGESSSIGAPEVDPEGESWRDMEIWKVFIGADVELNPELLPSTYVETED
ncbi:hypothetical protein [Streptomyces sp. NEAU-NA10]|uniref:hypothetical protein n=1 Tax=Streptomyces sp. NEAU-NA10 TaxID=3416050 RepID=UPI003CC68601